MAAAPPKPKRSEARTSLGQLINPQVLSDHFDHYGAPSMAKDGYDGNHNHQGRAPLLSESSRDYSDASYNPSSHVTDPPSRSPDRPTQPLLSAAAKGKATSNLSRDDTYITKIENDVRRRFVDSREPQKTLDDIALTSRAKKQHSRQQNLSQAISKQMGSMPDITSLEGLASMPKEDLMKLSAARRDEIRKLLEEQERRNAGDITVLASDVKVRLEPLQFFPLFFSGTLSHYPFPLAVV